MLEALIIFSLASVGSVVCFSTELAHRAVSRKSQGEAIATGPMRGRPAASTTEPASDPVLSFGFILACYGALALALVSELPGGLALERTGLAFAWLCVGGLIGKIASSGSNAGPPTDTEGEAVVPLKPVSLRLSVALTLVLNATLALFCSGQGLIAVVPPKLALAAHTEVLDPIIVVSARMPDSVRQAESL